ncbi:P-loop containing nucleoside triphosphate hydrolase protein [Xylariales sp. PMI_506]|nr:P-loop containing nucleoside triphosphate hydrolase protein [Xylariales sp. PMI_506]
MASSRNLVSDDGLSRVNTSLPALHDAQEKFEEIDRLRSQALHLQGPPQYHTIHAIDCKRSSKDHVRYFHEPWVEETALAEVSAVALHGTPHPSFKDQPSGCEEIVHPYLWWYHRRSEIDATRGQLDRETKEHLDVFREYILSSLSKDWEAVRVLTARRKINPQLIEYIFSPGSILVSTRISDDIADMEAFTAMNWLSVQRTQGRWDGGSIQLVSWTFDGNFQRSLSQLDLKQLPSAAEFDICDLPIYPVQFARPGVVEALQTRGKMFWKFSVRNYVSFKGFIDDGMQTMTDSRFMIDMITYKQMHPNPPEAKRPAGNRDDLGPALMGMEDPPLGADFYMCLPITILGFNMQRKEWDVEWNTNAFKHLVIEQGTKDLIEAVVTNQLRAEEGTDLIRGKGNGLFILLHGGPGTGTTLTAESVAEIAEKPLYRVTCGDIGTKAEDVEKAIPLTENYWKVVLLDEADVFLEQRSLMSLERNALVSGMLLLTSNRVGTFDEAFKSPIQLNLRYKNLDFDQRCQIWKNFIERLDAIERDPEKSTLANERSNSKPPRYGVNTKEILQNLSMLAKPELNGREIRNAISTARQLAQFRRQPLSYNHLNNVIQEALKFDDYLTELRKGLSADEVLKDQFVR